VPRDNWYAHADLRNGQTGTVWRRSRVRRPHLLERPRR
jgi:hypothetical protein